jgi:hypothetical protein
MCVSVLWDWLSLNAANVIAVCALSATFWQAYISRRHNRLSVVPYLTTWEEVIEGYIVFKIMNYGVGPARIKSFNIFVDDQKITGEKLEPHGKCLEKNFQGYNFIGMAHI